MGEIAPHEEGADPKFPAPLLIEGVQSLGFGVQSLGLGLGGSGFRV